MGCGCNKVAVGLAPAAPPVAGPVRTYYVDARGVREVTGMALPAKHQAVLAAAGRHQSGQTTSATAVNQLVVPGLLLGGAGGIALAKTVLMAHPFLAGLAGLSIGTWYVMSNLFECDPLLGSPSTDPATISSCQTKGLVQGALFGAGAGMILEGFIADYGKR
jgi:hypothetical protein